MSSEKQPLVSKDKAMTNDSVPGILCQDGHQNVNHSTVEFAEGTKPVNSTRSSLRHRRHHSHDEDEHLPLNSQIDMVSVHDDMNEGGEDIPFLEPGSVAASTFSLACISLGVGVFALPSVFAQMGLVLGSIIAILFAIASNVAILLLLSMAERHCLGSFEEVMEFAFGRIGRSTVSASLAICCTIANAGHLQFVAQLAADMFRFYCDGHMGDKISPGARAIIISIMGCTVLPFCFAKSLNALRYMSTTTVVYVVTLGFLCTIFAFKHMGEHGVAPEPVTFNFSPQVLLAGCPVIAFAYSSIASFFHVYREINDKTKIRKCLHMSTAICCTFYTTIALFGAMAFKAPSADYLYSFPPSNIVITVASAGLIVVIVLLYPVINYPLVAAIDQVLYPTQETSFKRRRIYSIVVLCAVVGLDTVVPKIELVFGLAGSLGLGLIAYALPCAAFLKLQGKEYQVMGAVVTPQNDWPRILAAGAILLLGLTMAIGSTSEIIYQAATQ